MPQFSRGWSPLPPAPPASPQPPATAGGCTVPPTVPSVFEGGVGEWFLFVPPDGACSIWNVTAVTPEQLQAQEGGGSWQGYWFDEPDARIALQCQCPGGGQPQPPQPPQQPIPPAPPQPPQQPQPPEPPQPPTPAGGDGGIPPITATGCKPWFTCPNIPDWKTHVSYPGSQAFCDFIPFALDGLRAIGSAVAQFLDGALNPDNLLSTLDNIPSFGSVTKPWGYPIDGFKAILRQLIKAAAPILCTLREAVKCAVSVTSAMFGNCDVGTLTGLLVVRILVRSIGEIEIGWDVAVWAVDRFRIEIPQLERILDYLIAYVCPTEAPDEEVAIEAFLRDYIPETLLRCILQLHGRDANEYMVYVKARSEKLAPKEAIQWVRRHKMGDDAERAALRALGWLDVDQREAFRELYWELPGIADHLEWLRKNVFDDEYVQHFKLMDGFEERFWPKFGDDLTALGMKKEYAALHYAAHWLNPSFSQQFDMVQRLRQGRVPDNLVFTRDDLLRTMQEMDVGVYFRERLEAVSHPVPNLTLTLQMYQYGTVDDDELIEMLKDLGFSDVNAAKIRDSQRIKVKRLQTSAAHGLTPTALGQAYAVGGIRADEVRSRMRELGFDDQYSDDMMRRSEIELKYSPIRRIQQQTMRSALATQLGAYKCGAISAEDTLSVYRNAGIPDDIARIAVSNVDSAIEVQLCNQQVNTFRQALIAGKATPEAIEEILLKVGIPPLRVKQYMDSWKLQLKVKAPAATASQILRWVGSGLLDASVARARLINLGWTDPDLALSLAESLSKLQSLQNRLQRQAAQSQAAAQKAALRLAKEAQQTAAAARRLARGIASIRTLQQWYAELLLDDTEFMDYADARGYDPDIAAKYLAEAQQKRFRRLHPKPPKKVAKAPGEPAIAALERFFKEGIVDEHALRDELKAMGTAPDEIERYVADAWAKATKGTYLGPEKGPASPPAPPAPPAAG